MAGFGKDRQAGVRLVTAGGSGLAQVCQVGLRYGEVRQASYGLVRFAMVLRVVTWQA